MYYISIRKYQYVKSEERYPYYELTTDTVLPIINRRDIRGKYILIGVPKARDIYLTTIMAWLFRSDIIANLKSVIVDYPEKPNVEVFLCEIVKETKKP